MNRWLGVKPSRSSPPLLAAKIGMAEAGPGSWGIRVLHVSGSSFDCAFGVFVLRLSAMERLKEGVFSMHYVFNLSLGIRKEGNKLRLTIEVCF